jgi:hypothetical protein
LANLLQNLGVFSWEVPSDFLVKEGMLDTQISALGVGQQYPGGYSSDNLLSSKTPDDHAVRGGFGLDAVPVSRAPYMMVDDMLLA